MTKSPELFCIIGVIFVCIVFCIILFFLRNRFAVFVLSACALSIGILSVGILSIVALRGKAFLCRCRSYIISIFVIFPSSCIIAFFVVSAGSLCKRFLKLCHWLWSEHTSRFRQTHLYLCIRRSPHIRRFTPPPAPPASFLLPLPQR